MAADPSILTDAVSAYVASMDDKEFASFTAAVREPDSAPDGNASGSAPAPQPSRQAASQQAQEQLAKRFGNRNGASK
ncbi:hypothetical protein D5S18_00305 [Nocardia panacis]|uniref:Uncharacterized protein n=1 Tax=Nocardia panacis TaxID=2340916 RepID=A0A3A4K4Q6_9NOCA|nr:hypothetical protein [Nocardia panacis]RJO80231.1 hypothetical protein D5S18_00305 [Nocardia panacis]